MTNDPFRPAFEDLPEEIPIFPLPGALLLPGGRLPLNIFEPRYLAMAFDALAEARMIGIIQPLTPEPDPVSTGAALYEIGCAGRIVSFAETGDGRLLITLGGVGRFRLAGELAEVKGYRRARADWTAFRDDLEGYAQPVIDRTALLDRLRVFLEAKGIDADLRALDDADDGQLVTSLAMMCPFEAQEKQALLEAADLGEVSRTMMVLMEMALGENGASAAKH